MSEKKETDNSMNKLNDKLIKVKAKALDGSGWCFGFVVEFNDVDQDKKLGYMIYNFSKNKYIKIKPETVCRQVGIEDKHGTKVFENDTLFDGKGWITIQYYENGFGYEFMGDIVYIAGHKYIKNVMSRFSCLENLFDKE